MTPAVRFVRIRRHAADDRLVKIDFRVGSGRGTLITITLLSVAGMTRPVDIQGPAPQMCGTTGDQALDRTLIDQAQALLRRAADVLVVADFQRRRAHGWRR